MLNTLISLAGNLIKESPVASAFIFTILGMIIHKIACHYGIDGSTKILAEMSDLKASNKSLMSSYKSIKEELDEIKDLAIAQQKTINELQVKLSLAASTERLNFIEEIKEQLYKEEGYDRRRTKAVTGIAVKKERRRPTDS